MINRAERMADLPETPFLVKLDDPLRAANCQLGFLKFLVAPLWSVLFELVADMKAPFETNMKENQQYWAEEVAKHEK